MGHNHNHPHNSHSDHNHAPVPEATTGNERKILISFFIIFIRAKKPSHYSVPMDCWYPHFLFTFITLFHNFFCFFPFSFFSLFFIFMWRGSIFLKTAGQKGIFLHFLI